MALVNLTRTEPIGRPPITLEQIKHAGRRVSMVAPDRATILFGLNEETKLAELHANWSEER
jgi:hypothetical protein